jgi:superfamily II DNA or RNA helicase
MKHNKTKKNHNKNKKSDNVKMDCNGKNKYSPQCNKLLTIQENKERDLLETNPTTNLFLYPSLNDPDFNIKISSKKEFDDTKYDGTIYTNIKEHSDHLSSMDYELSPHQLFVKNFMSFQTPYNSLLLYHGLGSGKTCSAIGVSEEMRDYLKHVGSSKQIIIVASENVQSNFRLQLFDESKLKQVDGVWSTTGCIGNKFLKEVNSTNMKITKEKLIGQIKSIINESYIFLGYIQFANYIISKSNAYDNSDQENAQVVKRLKAEFDNRLIIIDEIHNIRMTEDNENKKVGANLELLVKSADNLRLLLLSATPMYNSYKEIIWLLNLMNINDRRSTIELKDVFDSTGQFTSNGREILLQKARGYISFVRGENPYTFPYRVYPNLFSIQHTFDTSAFTYPKYQMNGKKLASTNAVKILKLYVSPIGDYQKIIYNYIIHTLRMKKRNTTTKHGTIRKMPTFENMDSFGYTVLQRLIETLNISYPYDGLSDQQLGGATQSASLSSLESLPSTISSLDSSSSSSSSESASSESSSSESESESSESSSSESESDESVDSDISSIASSKSSRRNKMRVMVDPAELTGKKGIGRIMTYIDTKNPDVKGSYEYKKDVINKYGRIFSKEQIGKYSHKINTIIENIVSLSGTVSEGIILIYSQYIDGGLIPVALALEEIGFTRYGENVKSLFKSPPVEKSDVYTMRPKIKNKSFTPAKYTMITGDIRLSPNNEADIRAITNKNNADGRNIKVVLISKAGSEGIDLKFIRQVHVLEPWYNMSQIEQIIGRAVRNGSHKDLPFEKRNVQIFMHGTILQDNKEESADVYIYRVAEYKAVQIGKVSRVLKEGAVDCIINQAQHNFTQANMETFLDEKITQVLSSGQTFTDFKVGDIPYSQNCDYMETCDYTCSPNKTITETDINQDTYSEKYMYSNSEKIINKIKLLMKERFFYKKNVLMNLIDVPKKYKLLEKYSALTQIIEDPNEVIVDKYGRSGKLINIGDYYLFQPLELTDNTISTFDRSIPVDYKHKKINFELNPDIVKPVAKLHVDINLDKNVNVPNNNKNNVFEVIKKNYEVAVSHISDVKIQRGDNDWYKHCGYIIFKLLNTMDIANKTKLIQFLINHIVESLVFHDKVSLLNYIYSFETLEENSIEFLIKSHFLTTTHKVQLPNESNPSHVMLLYNKNAQTNNDTVFVLNKELTMWEETNPEDKLYIQNAVTEWRIDNSTLNNIVGYIGYENKNQYMVFKSKSMSSHRNTGARCDEAGKIKTINALNEVLGYEHFSKENTSKLNLTQVDMCILLEFILRNSNSNKLDNKIWFLNPDVVLYNNF